MEYVGGISGKEGNALESSVLASPPSAGQGLTVGATKSPGRGAEGERLKMYKELHDKLKTGKQLTPAEVEIIGHGLELLERYEDAIVEALNEAKSPQPPEPAQAP